MIIKNLTKIILLTSLWILAACKNEHEKYIQDNLVDISEFKIDNSLLEDGDYVEVLGSSYFLKNEDLADYYDLVVARSEKTGDTLNILVTSYLYRSISDKKRLRFLSGTGGMGKVIESLPANTEDLKDISDLNDRLSKSHVRTKVFYDKKYIQGDVRKYPAITGVLADFSYYRNN